MICFTKKVIQMPRVQSMIIWALLLPFLATGIKWVFYTVMPASYFFYYESVEPAKEMFTDGENLVFESTFKVRNANEIMYNDILRCNTFGDDRGFYSQSITQIHSVHIGEKVSLWTYGGIVPAPPRTCFLDSTIEAHLPYGIKKVQQIESNPFIIR